MCHERFQQRELGHIQHSKGPIAEITECVYIDIIVNCVVKRVGNMPQKLNCKKTHNASRSYSY